MSQKQITGGNKPAAGSSGDQSEGQVKARSGDALKAAAAAEASLGQINLVYGAHDLNVDVVGLTVLEAQMGYKDVLSVEDDAEAYVNGKLVPDKANFKLKEGDRLEFMKEAGQKG